MKCLACGHNLKEYGKVSSKEILKCSYCGLGKTNRLNEQGGNYHRDPAYIEEETLFKNIFQKRANIINKLTDSGKALEVGCSTGILLSLLREKGWRVQGIEVSKLAAEAAKKRGIYVILQPFEKYKFNEKFDLVIFNHTLEHLQNPKDVVEKSYKLLNKNGLIYIDLPNFGGSSAKILGVKWPMLLPKEHLWNFSLKSLEILLRDIGFNIIYVERTSGIWDYANPLEGIFLSLFNFKKRFFIETLTAIPSLIISKLELGSDLMVIAKKV